MGTARTKGTKSTPLLRLSPKRRKFVDLILGGQHSAVAAYRAAYGASAATAKANASRVRHAPEVEEAIRMGYKAILESWTSVVSAKSRKGRLAKIMIDGSDSDAIRAVQELNRMEELERERGGGEGGEFSELIAVICRRRRLLPYNDPEDRIEEAIDV